MTTIPSEQVENAIGSDDVVVFMKGTREAPSCNFSAQIVELLNHLLPNYSTYDVREDATLRQAVKKRSGWPTFPQLYIRGEFIGGCDIAKELFATGELAERLGVANCGSPNPVLNVSRPALEALERLVGPGRVRLELDAKDEAHLSVSSKQSGDVELFVDAVGFVLDAVTAGRANGLRIDYVPEPGGFVITRPVILALSPNQVQRMLDSEAPRPVMVDCRTLAEFQNGTLPGAEHFDQELLRRLREAPDERRAVFFCRDGKRSHNVAEHFAAMRAAPAMYLQGGMEAWSTALDGTPD